MTPALREAPAEGDPNLTALALWSERTGERAVRAREDLFMLFRPFAERLARRHYRNMAYREIEYAELKQLAYAGLLEAIDRFDPGKEVPFTAYARRRVAGNIVDGVSKSSELREQLSFRNRVRRDRLRSLANDDLDQLSTEDSLRALSDLVVGLALGFMLEGAGLYGNDETPSPEPDAYESLAWKETTRRLAKELAALPDKERAIVRLHYLEGLQFDQIARMLELSKGRVSQLHKAALERLRRRLSSGRNFRVS